MAKMRGVVPEAVTGAYVFDDRGMLLLVKSPKWGERWMVPGGHIDLGETVFDCVAREVKEEVGIDVVPEGVLVIGEDIFPRDFHRKAHFMYFEIVCRTEGAKEIRLDGRETTGYEWFEPEDALASVDEVVLKKTIAKYISGLKNGKQDYIDIARGGGVSAD